jgi:hypothetical protein
MTKRYGTQCGTPRLRKPSEHDKALAVLDDAKAKLADVWPEIYDDELFRAVRTALWRLDQARTKIRELAEAKAKHEAE